MPGMGTKAKNIYINKILIINHNTYKLNVSPTLRVTYSYPFIETYTEADTLPLLPRL